MPLTEDEQKKIERIENGLNDMLASIDQYDDFPRQAAAMGKLDTRGKQPDFSTFSDQELRDIHDRGKLNPDINALPDNAPDSIISLAESGKSSASLTRKELETTVDKWLASKNYAIPPQDLAAARINHLTSVDRSTGGQIQQMEFDYWNVQETAQKRGESYSNPAIEAKIKDAKAQSVAKIVAAEKDLSAIASQGVNGSLEMAGKNNASPDQVAELLDKGRHLIAAGEIDLSGTELTGVDLSKSDLSRVKIDSATLSKASGLKEVKGLDPEIKAEALGRQRLQQLEDQKAKLQNPSITDRLKGFIKHGTHGVSGEIESIDKKIAATKEAMDRSFNKGMSVGDQREVVNQMKGLDQKLAREIAVAHNAGGQLAVGNTFDVKSKDDYSADDKKLGKLAAKEETLKTDRESVRDALKKESRVLKAMEKIDAPQESKTMGRKL